MPKAAERLFCDTNVLLSAVDRRRGRNRQALLVLDELPNRGVELCISGQVVREFIVVCTRPVQSNGLGLATEQAVGNIRAIIGRTTVLEETRHVANELMRLVEHHVLGGKRIHDANIVATMLAHGVDSLVTDNVTDFGSYGDIKVIDLASAAST